MLATPFIVHSQAYNVIQNWVAQKPITQASDIISSHPAQEVVRNTQYIDGFGRSVQSVVKGISPLQQDAVAMHIYDSWGRETQQFLPFVSGNDGAFKNNAQSLQSAFNQGLYPGENSFYSQVDLENSPLNRVLKNYAPGSSWVGSSRGTSAEYLVNTVTDNVRIWNISSAQGSIPTTSAAYLPGQLYKTISIDEKMLQTITYRDKDGHLVLQKSQQSASPDDGSGSSHSGWLCSYYVYDDFGNMRFAITPKVVALIDGSWTISQTNADELCYRFEYDDFGRVIIEKAPGTGSGSAGEVWIVYDQRGRVAMRQDGSFRSQQKWQYVQYDAQDRVMAAGRISDANNRAYHQNIAIGQINYPNLSNYSPEVLTQNYYDNYNWVAGTGSGLGASLDASNNGNTNLFYSPNDALAPFPQTIQQTTMTRGFLTGSKTEVLESGGAQYLYTVSFYDDKGRMVQTQSNNIANGIDKATTQYSWTGVPLRLYEQHVNNTLGQTHAILTKLSYDHAWRLQSIVKNVSSMVNGNPVNSGDRTIASYTYSETGLLNSKTVGNSLETLNYDYNVRGWLTGINKNYTLAASTGHWIGEELGYDKTTTVAGTTSFITPVYNGSVTGQVWRSRGDGVPRKYDYSYDNLNQLTSAGYLQNTAGSVWDKSYMDFSVNNMSYDLNGNIKALNQNGFVLGGVPNIDNLNYNYLNTDNSNRLQNVIDNANIATSKIGDFHYAGSKTAGSTDYSYDNNGNLASDANKSISSITYNALDLPYILTFAKGTITFMYDAAGNKLRKTVQENNATVNYNGTDYLTNITTVTTYIGGFVYQSKSYSNTPNLSPLNQPEALIFAPQDEGRMRLATQSSGSLGWVFDYFIRDHLGNVRTILTDESQADTYPATTLESAGITYEKKYYNITNDANHIIPTGSLTWWSGVSGNNYTNGNGLPVPPDPTVNPGGANTNLYKLNGATGDRFGMGIALKVMVGDAVNIYGNSVWHDGGQTTDNSSYKISGVLGSFLDAFAGTNAVVAGSKGTATGTILNGNSNITQLLSSILNNVGTPTGQKPKAYINWILFDEQFKPVAGGCGADAISDYTNTVKPHTITGSININTSGYLYIYCSNESNQDVYFDNLQVVHTRGPLLEERQYYPDGLSMFALNSRAFGKLQTNFGYQGKEMQNGEFYDGSGLEEYDFDARYYDPQLGRWWAQDPASQFASPYNAMGNNWINGIDPNGKWFGLDDLVAAGIGFVMGYVSHGITTGHWGGEALAAGGIGAVSGWLAYNTCGLSASSVGSSWTWANIGTFATDQALGLASSAFPGMNVQIGNFSFGISPMMSTSGGGISINGGWSDGTYSVGLSYGFGERYGTNDLSGKFANDSKGGYSSWMVSGSATINSTTYGGSYGKYTTTGKLAQSIKLYGLQVGDFGIRVDEDYDKANHDRWYTGGETFTYRINNEATVAVGFAAITGEKNGYLPDCDPKSGKNVTDPSKEMPYAYRSGALYGGIIYRGNASFLGINSERLLHGVQNAIHDHSPFGIFDTPWHFGNSDPALPSKPWSYFGSYSNSSIIY
jgi:RHS repeat-associated protein